MNHFNKNWLNEKYQKKTLKDEFDAMVKDFIAYLKEKCFINEHGLKYVTGATNLVNLTLKQAVLVCKVYSRQLKEFDKRK